MSISTFRKLAPEKRLERKLFITFGLNNSLKNLEEMITDCKDDNTKTKKIEQD